MLDQGAAGFSTPLHGDHLLWHPRFGDVPRYAAPASVDALRRGAEPVDARLDQDRLAGPRQADLEQAGHPAGWTSASSRSQVDRSADGGHTPWDADGRGPTPGSPPVGASSCG